MFRQFIPCTLTREGTVNICLRTSTYPTTAITTDHCVASNGYVHTHMLQGMRMVVQAPVCWATVMARVRCHFLTALQSTGVIAARLHAPMHACAYIQDPRPRLAGVPAWACGSFNLRAFRGLEGPGLEVTGVVRGGCASAPCAMRAFLLVWQVEKGGDG